MIMTIRHHYINVLPQTSTSISYVYFALHLPKNLLNKTNESKGTLVEIDCSAESTVSVSHVIIAGSRFLLNRQEFTEYRTRRLVSEQTARQADALRQANDVRLR